MAKTIVLGGSFNPPTIAHEKIIIKALDDLKADVGIFVPSSDAYVRRKMKRTNQPNFVISELDRTKMLAEICKHYNNLTFSTIEYDTSSYSGHTYETLKQLKDVNNDEIYFIFGSDKLDVFTRWSTYEKMVTEFKIIIFSRKHNDVLSQIQKNAKLNKHKNAFIILTPPENINDISSTKVREYIAANKDCSKLLRPEVRELIR